MTCAQLQDRLYDEDVRQAFLADEEPPADLQAHVARCAECRAEWSAAREDALRLRRDLEEPPPPHLRAAIADTWTQARAARLRALDWTAALSWAGAAGALVAGSLRAFGGSLPLGGSAGVFAVAATCAFAVQVTAAVLSDAASGRA